MTAPPPPPPQPGRRGNGLPAADWGALVDVDPRLADGLLDSLAAAGVPAYVEPASASDPFSRAPLPSRPLDRLWVDPARAERAREVVADQVRDLAGPDAAGAVGLVQPVPRHAVRRVLAPPPLPEPPGRPTTTASSGGGPPDEVAEHDDDAVFRSIVAGFDRTSDDPVPRWPVLEDTDPAAGGPPAAADLDAARRRPPPVDGPQRRRRDDPPLPEWLEPPALEPEPDARDERDHYVPPPPPPAPRVQPRTLGAVAALLLGLVLVFAPELLRQRSSAGSLLLGAGLLVGGAGALVWWMRDAPPPDAGPGDGAVV